jgi:hypothetical protein
MAMASAAVVMETHKAAGHKEHGGTGFPAVPRLSLDGMTGTGAQGEDPGIAMDKSYVIERLVLEDTIVNQFVRLMVFLLQIGIFIMNLSEFYPSEKINMVHKSLITTVGLDEFAVSPTGPELMEYMRATLEGLQDLAPNSLKWVEDPSLKKLLPDPQEFDPEGNPKVLTPEEEPVLTEDFTFLIWVQTANRIEHIISKRQDVIVGGKKQELKCWEISAEHFSQGEHEGKLVKTYNPDAEDLFHPKDIVEKAYVNSTIKSISDEQWHHIGIQVKNGRKDDAQIRFILDGAFVRGDDPDGGWRALPRPITDCTTAAKVQISAEARVMMFDLQWFPTVLTREEVNDIMTNRIILDDLIATAGANPPVVDSSSMVLK